MDKLLYWVCLNLQIPQVMVLWTRMTKRLSVRLCHSIQVVLELTVIGKAIDFSVGFTYQIGGDVYNANAMHSFMGNKDIPLVRTV